MSIAKKEIIGAFVFSPLIATISGDAILNIGAALLGHKAEFGWFSALGAFVGYPVVVVLGIPIFLLMKRQRWVSHAAFCVAGLVISFTALGLVLGFGAVSLTNKTDIGNLSSIVAITSVVGLVGGTVFRALACIDGQQPE